MIETKDVLEWCIVLSALILGVYGFLFSVYVTAVNTMKAPPSAFLFLRQFCCVLTGVLVALCVIAAWSGLTAEHFIGWKAWSVLFCLFVVTAYSFLLTMKLGW
ncbi:hypothetical protein LJ656_27420 [Paraburkholderia sp. MMS20-SJTR3]|uniref:Uncharacterized protein n=1 Tax=Paraburkholderia sejongensis TaxID=2886946 RepID=A0ABS8K2F2_9BURK|nr:hypothetical protein [Paraburkholderia sp. MMS20-SJTR3]MCC8396325.1 hypothetical protein [Paraburkholderia sp. MMS20-SJTR3]